MCVARESYFSEALPTVPSVYKGLNRIPHNLKETFISFSIIVLLEFRLQFAVVSTRHSFAHNVSNNFYARIKLYNVRVHGCIRGI